MIERRNFFKVVALIAPKLARAQAAKTIDPATMRELAAVALPESLGRKRTDKIADDFVQWVRDYKEGVNMASGYGHPRTQIVPANPSKLYPEQLQVLQAAFANADIVAKRAAVERALGEAGVDRLPNRPNGKHVAADLLAYFYRSSDGEDLLYDAAIKRSECRGLGNSAQRPASLT